MMRIACLIVLTFASIAPAQKAGLERVKYNNPGLIVDLGVGLWGWPLPMDYDGDGDLDLIVSCSDTPYNGTYFFENPGAIGGNAKMPVFNPGVKIGPGIGNIGVSYVDGKPRVLVPAAELTGFTKGDLKTRAKLHSQSTFVEGGRVRANQWSYVDYDGDGELDLIVGHGFWGDYGWDNAFNEKGEWTRGPLRGYIYLLRNKGTAAKPDYEAALQLKNADGNPIDVFGMPSPSFADFDGDGDLDLLCGSFLDGFTYFQNIGTRKAPKYAAGRRLMREGKPLVMHLCMIVVSAIDWDSDGDTDLIVGQEDGRVAFIEHTGQVKDGVPVFAEPRFFQQQADEVKFGALVTPVSFDWDGDGDEDLVCGNTAGEIGFIENLNGANPPRWAAPKLLEVNGQPIRILAGTNGSIQGPAEAKWGYTTLDVGDWDHDGLPDIIVNSIWGKVVWHRNIGTRKAPKLAAAQPIEVQWKGKAPKPAWNWWEPNGNELATQWRTTPLITDWNGDGLNDLIMLDHEGYLALFRREKQGGNLILHPGERVFLEGDKPLRLNAGTAGKSGRRKLCLVDWDGDGRCDLLVNSVNVNFYRNVSDANGKTIFADMGPLDSRKLAGHTTSPTTVDWDGNGVRDLLVGGEDGYLYCMANPREPVAIDATAAIVSRSLIYELEGRPTPQCHASTIAQTTDGSLVAAWFGGSRESADDVGIWVARFIDGKWTKPVEVAKGSEDEEKDFACWNPVLFQRKDGALMLFYKVGPSPSKWWGVLMTSTDGGKTWENRRKLGKSDAIGNLLGPVKNKPIQLADGSILCGSSTEHQGWRVHFEISRDMGKTWQVIGPIHEATKFNAIQPSILRYGDGGMQILCRTREGVLGQAWSSDGGKTWSEVTATELPNPNAGTDAVTLKDGRQLLVYNHTKRTGEFPSGRNMLNVAVSKDGKAWHAALTLERDRSEFSYPAVIQTSDGKVHITYTWKRQSVKHVVIDPDKLKLTPIEGGKWPQ
ncbi:MAG: exo-alpha-sialidase [Phycisphaeraceae bacterium]